MPLQTLGTITLLPESLDFQVVISFYTPTLCAANIKSWGKLISSCGTVVSIEHKISVRFLWGHSDANLPTSFSMTEVLKLCYSWAIKERAKTDWAKSFGPLLTSSKWYILGDLHNTILGLLNTMGQYFAQTTWSHCSQPSLCIS